MTTLTHDLGAAPRAERPLRPGRLEWGHAFRAFQRLRADKEDTYQVFEIMRALTGRSLEKGYLRLIHTPEGGRMAFEHKEFAERLMDRAWVESFAPGTVGAAYADFTSRENISAEGLIEESRKGVADGEADLAHPLAWYGRRIRDTHDLWHILTGYGRDALGEACLVAFSYAQTRSLGWAFIAVGAALSAGDVGKLPVRRAILEGYRRGKAAKWLPAQDYERLMAEPLEAARKRLNLTPPVLYNSIPRDQRDSTEMAVAA